MSPVLDASVFIAAISPTERHHHQARRLFESHPDTEPFLVPDLFRVEVIAGLSRRGEPADLLDTVDAVIRRPRFAAPTGLSPAHDASAGPGRRGSRKAKHA